MFILLTNLNSFNFGFYPNRNLYFGYSQYRNNISPFYPANYSCNTYNTYNPYSRGYYGNQFYGGLSYPNFGLNYYNNFLSPRNSFPSYYGYNPYNNFGSRFGYSSPFGFGSFFGFNPQSQLFGPGSYITNPYVPQGTGYYAYGAGSRNYNYWGQVTETGLRLPGNFYSPLFTGRDGLIDIPGTGSFNLTIGPSYIDSLLSFMDGGISNYSDSSGPSILDGLSSMMDGIPYPLNLEYDTDCATCQMLSHGTNTNGNNNYLSPLAIG